MKYKHTQIGYLTIFISIVLALFFAVIYIIVGELSVLLTGILLLTFISISFYCLTISINEEYLKIKFGFGIWNKHFLLSDIESVKQVKNRWYYGWGIRVWLWPFMWIYNISGFDAVEIVMKNGKIIRLGSDEAEKLTEAIINEIK